MKKALYYKNNLGHIICSDEIERAFLLVTGKYRFEDERGYLKFLYSLLGKTILAVAAPSIESFLEADSKIRAVKWYRDEHGCSLAEARAAVEKTIAEMF